MTNKIIQTDKYGEIEFVSVFNTIPVARASKVTIPVGIISVNQNKRIIIHGTTIGLFTDNEIEALNYHAVFMDTIKHSNEVIINSVFDLQKMGDLKVVEAGYRKSLLSSLRTLKEIYKDNEEIISRLDERIERIINIYV